MRLGKTFSKLAKLINYLKFVSSFLFIFCILFKDLAGEQLGLLKKTVLLVGHRKTAACS